MKTFKQYLAESNRQEALSKLTDLFEHEIYNRVPGTTNSYRQDPANTNTRTQKHSHVYAKLNGGGNELYAVNLDGSGHDGSGGIQIPSVHADHFRSLGYDINTGNVLESLDVEKLEEKMHRLVLLNEANA